MKYLLIIVLLVTGIAPLSACGNGTQEIDNEFASSGAEMNYRPFGYYDDEILEIGEKELLSPLWAAKLQESGYIPRIAYRWPLTIVSDRFMLDATASLTVVGFKDISDSAGCLQYLENSLAEMLFEPDANFRGKYTENETDQKVTLVPTSDDGESYYASYQYSSNDGVVLIPAGKVIFIIHAGSMSDYFADGVAGTIINQSRNFLTALGVDYAEEDFTRTEVK